MVLEGGVEPPRSFGAPDFESGASASSATPAGKPQRKEPNRILPDLRKPHQQTTQAGYRQEPQIGSSPLLPMRPAAGHGTPARRSNYWLTTCSGRGWRSRSSYLPKIILPAVVCKTLVTEMSMVFEIIFLALSTTTIVPSSR